MNTQKGPQNILDVTSDLMLLYRNKHRKTIRNLLVEKSVSEIRPYTISASCLTIVIL
jgi:hypothetical protein